MTAGADAGKCKAILRDKAKGVDLLCEYHLSSCRKLSAIEALLSYWPAVLFVQSLSSHLLILGFPQEDALLSVSRPTSCLYTKEHFPLCK